ncbi:Putative invertase inhibitor [Apostasia shenzhenica]|uniref:Invertase inhibitor n=1 Tax=Apostasia shenzhenica TaxID=1088818 RepID=A0A2H9ZVS3_9ASPA|nr:Putative invertase inhibitor [Apostasia shenzhenica]
MAKSALLIFLFLLAPLATADIVVETCKTIAAGDPLLNYKYCVSLFNSVPSSHNTDVKGLALISTQLATQKVKHVLADINNLLKSAQPGRNPKTGCLKTCEELYTDAINFLQHYLIVINTTSPPQNLKFLSSSSDSYIYIMLSIYPFLHCHG